MMPTLKDGDFVRVSRRSYRCNEPKRWDIVLFLHPYRRRFWELKRVVGLPGESVEIHGSHLVINGSNIDDVYAEKERESATRAWRLEDDEFIVLGDNRAASTDSRNFGPIKRGLVHGRAVLPKERS